jgi:hypothetical protein
MALPRQPALPLSLEVVVVLSVGALAVVETAEAEVVEVAVTFLDSASAAVVAAAGTCPHQHCLVDSLVPAVLSMLGLASNSHHHLTSGSPYSLVQQQL